jgi:hypothetical protein
MKTLEEALTITGISKTMFYIRLKRIDEYDQADPENNESRYIATNRSPTRIFTDMTVEKVKEAKLTQNGRPKKAVS